VIGISALPLSVHPLGGVVEGIATLFFGFFFLLSLSKSWWHIWNGRAEFYREWVTRMVAIALGVAATRPSCDDLMGLFFATRPLTGLFATAVFWASNVDRVHFDLSRGQGPDQLHPIASRPKPERSDLVRYGQRRGMNRVFVSQRCRCVSRGAGGKARTPRKASGHNRWHGSRRACICAIAN
jgi:hypothetical protein